MSLSVGVRTKGKAKKVRVRDGESACEAKRREPCVYVAVRNECAPVGGVGDHRGEHIHSLRKHLLLIW